MTRRDRALAALLPTILAIVALSQIAVAHTSPLTPWKGGGFGMFSTVDTPGHRHIHATITTPDGTRHHLPHTTLSRYNHDIINLKAHPTDARLTRTAQQLASSQWTLNEDTGRPQRRARCDHLAVDGALAGQLQLTVTGTRNRPAPAGDTPAALSLEPVELNRVTVPLCQAEPAP